MADSAFEKQYELNPELVNFVASETSKNGEVNKLSAEEKHQYDILIATTIISLTTGECLKAVGSVNPYTRIGSDQDVYVVGEGTTHIYDEDNDGVLVDMDGNLLNGAWIKIADGMFQNSATGAGRTLEGSVFTINWGNGNSAVIHDFEEGRFGIRFFKEREESADPVIDVITKNGGNTYDFTGLTENTIAAIQGGANNANLNIVMALHPGFQV